MYKCWIVLKKWRNIKKKKTIKRVYTLEFLKRVYLSQCCRGSMRREFTINNKHTKIGKKTPQNIPPRESIIWKVLCVFFNLREMPKTQICYCKVTENVVLQSLFSSLIFNLYFLFFYLLVKLKKWWLLVKRGKAATHPSPEWQE